MLQEWPGQQRAEVLWHSTQWRPKSCKGGSHPGTDLPHAWYLENKKSQPLTAKPSAAQVWCDLQGTTGQLQNWSWLLCDQPPAHTGHHIALPIPLSPANRHATTTHRTAEVSPVWHYREPSGVLVGAQLKWAGSLGEILRLVYRIITVWQCTLQVPSKANPGVVTHGGKEKGVLGFHLFSFFKA